MALTRDRQPSQTQRRCLECKQLKIMQMTTRGIITKLDHLSSDLVTEDKASRSSGATPNHMLQTEFKSKEGRVAEEYAYLIRTANVRGNYLIVAREKKKNH